MNMKKSLVIDCNQSMTTRAKNMASSFAYRYEMLNL